MADILVNGELVFMRADPLAQYTPQFIIWVRRYAETKVELQPVASAITKILDMSQDAPNQIGMVVFKREVADLLDSFIPIYQKIYIHEGGRA